jgi:hypothetical protein
MEQANQSKAVNQYLEKLDHPLKAEIEKVRALILSSDSQITEHIKWNAPSFCYQGEDRVTFRLFPATDRIQLIFHRGVKIKDSTDFAFPDESGLLQWLADDRATLIFHSMSEIEANAAAFQNLISRWMAANTVSSP